MIHAFFFLFYLIFVRLSLAFSLLLFFFHPLLLFSLLRLFLFLFTYRFFHNSERIRISSMPLRRFRQCLDGIQISSILIFSCLAARSHTILSRIFYCFFRLCFYWSFLCGRLSSFFGEIIVFPSAGERKKQ